MKDTPGKHYSDTVGVAAACAKRSTQASLKHSIKHLAADKATKKHWYFITDESYVVTYQLEVRDAIPELPN